MLLVEPYNSGILPHWHLKTPEIATERIKALQAQFEKYRADYDFIGMDMTRKFMQMGHTRARRYANQASGRKYDEAGNVLPFENDEVKAQSAALFYAACKALEADEDYGARKKAWKESDEFKVMSLK